jgi:hypothetical protein
LWAIAASAPSASRIVAAIIPALRPVAPGGAIATGCPVTITWPSRAFGPFGARCRGLAFAGGRTCSGSCRVPVLGFQFELFALVFAALLAFL